jgi:hypothetical protein
MASLDAIVSGQIVDATTLTAVARLDPATVVQQGKDAAIAIGQRLGANVKAQWDAQTSTAANDARKMQGAVDAVDLATHGYNPDDPADNAKLVGMVAGAVSFIPVAGPILGAAVVLLYAIGEGIAAILKAVGLIWYGCRTTGNWTAKNVLTAIASEGGSNERPNTGLPPMPLGSFASLVMPALAKNSADLANCKPGYSNLQVLAAMAHLWNANTSGPAITVYVPALDTTGAGARVFAEPQQSSAAFQPSVTVHDILGDLGGKEGGLFGSIGSANPPFILRLNGSTLLRPAAPTPIASPVVPLKPGQKTFAQVRAEAAAARAKAAAAKAAPPAPTPRQPGRIGSTKRAKAAAAAAAAAVAAHAPPAPPARAVPAAPPAAAPPMPVAPPPVSVPVLPRPLPVPVPPLAGPPPDKQFRDRTLAYWDDWTQQHGDAPLPGLGRGIPSAIAAAKQALQQGQPLEEALRAAYQTIPVPATLKTATDPVLDSMIALSAGVVSDRALAVTRDRVPQGVPRDVFDTLAHVIVKAQPVLQAPDLAAYYVQQYTQGLADAVAKAVSTVAPAVQAALQRLPDSALMFAGFPSELKGGHTTVAGYARSHGSSSFTPERKMAMEFFENLLHDVGATVAGTSPHPPEVINAAVETTARALLGQRSARAKVARLGKSSPELRQLFGQVHRKLMAHPHFQHTLSAAELHKRPRPEHQHHPRAAEIAHGVVQTMNAAEGSLPGLLEDLGRAKLSVAHDEFEVAGETAYDVGARHPAFRVGAGAHAHAPHAAPRHVAHAAPRAAQMRHHRHPHPEPVNVFWGGPWGYGGDYLFDEREELEDHDSPADTEPEWLAQPTQWMGD